MKNSQQSVPRKNLKKMNKNVIIKMSVGAVILLAIIGGIYILISSDNGSGPIVTIANGQIQGKKMSSFKNKDFFGFMGIPFAKPPTGELRFQPPQEPDNWNGVLFDENSNKICPQLSSELLAGETEDCLYLSVYTPQVPSDNQNVSFPVMVFIHGGGFMSGSANIDKFGPQYLIDFDVVMVSIQYRIGMLGFLSTQDLNCPGNNGLKDQQMALRWIQKNIESFGGDPQKVTLFGESAAGASVGYHLLGSKNENLFRGVIQHSGSPISVWAFQRDAKKMAYQFASKINPEIDETNSTEEVLKFLRTVNIEQIKKTSVDLFGKTLPVNFYKLRLGYIFAPVIEIEHESSFITQDSLEKFQSGNYLKVPMLMGINSEEALFIAEGEKFPKAAKDFDMDHKNLVSPGLNIIDVNIKALVGDSIYKIYAPNGSFQHNLGSFVKFFSDEGFVRGMIKQAKIQANDSNVFFYEFAFKTNHSSCSADTEVPGADNVCHAAEMVFLFHSAGVDASMYPEGAIKIMNGMLTMWTNFIKHQNPTPEAIQTSDDVVWEKLNPIQFNYLLINETLEMKTELKKKPFEEFDALYEQYALPPHTTY